MAPVTVVIPTFNRAPFLTACIESVLTAGIPDIEIIVVDDGSTDNTEQVVRDLGAGVRYIRQNNAGPAAARNNGARHASAEYLCFLDSDDAWLEGAPPHLLNALHRNPSFAAAFADTEMGCEETGYVSFVETYGGVAFRELPRRRIDATTATLAREPFFRQLAIRNVMFLGSLLVRRDAFEALHGFDESLCGAADWDLFLRLAANHDLLFVDGPPVSRYLKHVGGMSNDSDHMGREFERALTHVLAVTSLQPAEATHVRSLLARHRFDLGWGSYDRGDMAEARRRFMFAVRSSGMNLKVLAYLALCCLPPRLVMQTRLLKRRIAA